MSNRRYAEEEKIAERYFYPQSKDCSPVLINKLNIKEQILLEIEENNIINAMTASRPKLDTFSLNEIKAIHQHLFSPIYHWAGKLRDYTTGRAEIPFARPERIESFYQKQIFEKLKNDDYLIGSHQEEFIQKSAYFINEFNAIHPFVDGNGRLTRIFLSDLAEKSGHQINLKFIDKENWYKAMEIGFLNVDTTLIQQEIRKCINIANA